MHKSEICCNANSFEVHSPPSVPICSFITRCAEDHDDGNCRDWVSTEWLVPLRCHCGQTEICAATGRNGIQDPNKKVNFIKFTSHSNSKPDPQTLIFMGSKSGPLEKKKSLPKIDYLSLVKKSLQAKKLKEEQSKETKSKRTLSNCYVQPLVFLSNRTTTLRKKATKQRLEDEKRKAEEKLMNFSTLKALETQRFLACKTNIRSNLKKKEDLSKKVNELLRQTPWNERLDRAKIRLGQTLTLNNNRGRIIASNRGEKKIESAVGNSNVKRTISEPKKQFEVTTTPKADFNISITKQKKDVGTQYSPTVLQKAKSISKVSSMLNLKEGKPAEKIDYVRIESQPSSGASSESRTLQKPKQPISSNIWSCMSSRNSTTSSMRSLSNTNTTPRRKSAGDTTISGNSTGRQTSKDNFASSTTSFHLKKCSTNAMNKKGGGDSKNFSCSDKSNSSVSIKKIHTTIKTKSTRKQTTLTKSSKIEYEPPPAHSSFHWPSILSLPSLPSLTSMLKMQAPQNGMILSPEHVKKHQMQKKLEQQRKPPRKLEGISPNQNQTKKAETYKPKCSEKKTSSTSTTSSSISQQVLKKTVRSMPIQDVSRKSDFSVGKTLNTSSSTSSNKSTVCKDRRTLMLSVKSETSSSTSSNEGPLRKDRITTRPLPVQNVCLKPKQCENNLLRENKVENYASNNIQIEEENTKPKTTARKSSNTSTIANKTSSSTSYQQEIRTKRITPVQNVRLKPKQLENKVLIKNKVENNALNKFQIEKENSKPKITARKSSNISSIANRTSSSTSYQQEIKTQHITPVQNVRLKPKQPANKTSKEYKLLRNPVMATSQLEPQRYRSNTSSKTSNMSSERNIRRFQSPTSSLESSGGINPYQAQFLRGNQYEIELMKKFQKQNFNNTKRSSSKTSGTFSSSSYQSSISVQDSKSLLDKTKLRIYRAIRQVE